MSTSGPVPGSVGERPGQEGGVRFPDAVHSIRTQVSASAYHARGLPYAYSRGVQNINILQIDIIINNIVRYSPKYFFGFCRQDLKLCLLKFEHAHF